MSSMDASPSADGQAPRPQTAGQMLRAARAAKGLHLAVLSVNLKVSVRQLEALEADRYEELKGAAFVRALAQSVCRQLQVDPTSILAALPKGTAPKVLVPVAVGPRQAAVRSSARATSAKGLSRQVLVLAALMLAGAAALIWWPNMSASENDNSEVTTATAANAVVMGQAQNPEQTPDDAAVPASTPAVPPAGVASTPVVALSVPSASVPAAVPAQAPLFLHLRADAWVEVRDSRGQMAVRRMVKAGEMLNLDLSGAPFVYVGRADSVELRWQGQAVDLKPHTRNNEARLQLQP